jgi:hypothetical protein
MFEAFSPPHRRRTLVLFVACGVLAAAAVVVGTSDNLPGLTLAYLSCAALVLAFVHPWRTSRQFRRLIYASVLAFVVFLFLTNLLEAAGPSLVAGVCFFIDILLCPAGFVVGVVGALATANWRRHSPPHAPAA